MAAFTPVSVLMLSAGLLNMAILQKGPGTFAEESQKEWFTPSISQTAATRSVAKPRSKN